MTTTVTVKCRTCIVCGVASEVSVPREGYEAWLAGAYAQNAFPEMDAPEREVLISGTHPACWEKLWA